MNSIQQGIKKCSYKTKDPIKHKINSAFFFKEDNLDRDDWAKAPNKWKIEIHNAHAMKQIVRLQNTQLTINMKSLCPFNEVKNNNGNKTPI